MLAVVVARVALAPGAAAQLPSPIGPRQALQLVMPFENATGEPRIYWLSEASAVLLTDDLTALGTPVDSPRGSASRVRAPARAARAALSHATVIRLGQVVGAAQVVVGALRAAGDELTVRARTIRLDTGRMSPELVERGPLADMLSVYGRIARRMVPDSAMLDRPAGRGLSPPLPAFEQYIKGLLAEAPDDADCVPHAGSPIVADVSPCTYCVLGSAYRSGRSSASPRCRHGRSRPDDPLARQARFLGAMSLLHLGQLPGRVRRAHCA